MDDLLFVLGFTVLTLLSALVVVLLPDLLSNPQGQVLKQRRKAEQRANTLLKEWLSPEQLAQFESRGHFEVQGSNSGKFYRIRREWNMNIDELNSRGSRAAVWCFGPAGRLPLGDHMLAQKIALETDEQAALAVANRAWTENRRGRSLQSNRPSVGVSSVTPVTTRQL
jgi:hypothetical protein